MAAHRHEARLVEPGALAAVVLVVAVAGLLSRIGPAGAADVGQLPTPITTLPAVSVPSVTAPPVSVIHPPSTADVGALAPSTGGGGGRMPKSARVGGAGAGAGAGVPLPAGTAVPSPPSTAATASVSRMTVPAPGPTLGDRAGATTTAGRREPETRALTVRLRRAAAETVQQLTFPMGLALAALVFLMLQHRLDKGDPRVAAPVDSGDDLLGFS